MINEKEIPELATEKDYLTLKWGTLKAWKFQSAKAKKNGALELLKEYQKLGSSLSAALQQDTLEQKKIICKLIDAGNFTKVFLDWEGKYVSKTEAKKYVLGY